jgi:hypothetical protein
MMEKGATPADMRTMRKETVEPLMKKIKESEVREDPQ